MIPRIYSVVLRLLWYPMILKYSVVITPYLVLVFRALIPFGTELVLFLCSSYILSILVDTVIVRITCYKGFKEAI